MSDRKFSFEVNRTSSAPPAVLFRLETDGAGWSKWAGPMIVRSSWERQGDPPPAGIGAIRKVDPKIPIIIDGNMGDRKNLTLWKNGETRKVKIKTTS